MPKYNKDLFGKAFKQTIDNADRAEKNDIGGLRSAILVVIAIFGLAVLLLRYPIKSFLRTGFGENVVDWMTPIGNTTIFIGVGTWILIENYQYPFFKEDFILGLLIGFFYILFGITTGITGIQEFIRSKQSDFVNKDYEGTSILFGILHRDGWTKTQIRLIGEPLFLFAIGLFLTTSIHLYIGIPFLLSAASLWLFGLADILYNKETDIQYIIDKKGYKKSEGEFAK